MHKLSSSLLLFVILFFFTCEGSGESSSKGGPAKAPAKKENLGSVVSTQKAVQATESNNKNPLPPLFADAQGQTVKMDFSLDLESISTDETLFSHYANKPLLIFFFSARCGHCQKTFPYIQTEAKELESKGVSTIAISVGSNTNEDLKSFREAFKMNLPLFRDTKGFFSRKYGTGYVPVMFTVLSNQTFRQFSSFNPEVTLDQFRAAF